jgi:hypothetical protein
MTETIRRLRRLIFPECKAYAKHERTRNDEHGETFSEMGVCSGWDDVNALDDCRPLGSLQVKFLME